MLADRVLIDTNVFVYATDESSPYHSSALAFIDAVGGTGCVTPQVLFELVSVVTNPKRVARVRSTEEAWAVADLIASSLTVLVPPPDVFEQASRMGRAIGVHAHDVFDLAIGITALASGVRRVATFDSKVFSRVPGLSVERPTNGARRSSNSVAPPQ